MLYRSLVRFMSLVARTFYRRIEVVGLENVPANGAVILAGNHPNALIDGLLLMCHAGRTPVHLLGNAKLWRIPLLARLLDAIGAVPVMRREENGPKVDNRDAFERVDDVLARGGCIVIFPEGISHSDSQLSTLKTGTARMALRAAANREAEVAIVPFGLTYLERHRFRSQVLLHFGAPMHIEERRLAAYRDDKVGAVRKLTADLRKRLSRVTLNAPDWATLRFIHAARRLYKPMAARLTPSIYVDLSRRFIEHYTRFAGEPDIQRLRDEIEAYQTRLEVLGLKDYQLTHSVSVRIAMTRIIWRSALVILLLPFALPGAIVVLPIAWLATTVSSWYSYDVDDIATLKVTTAVPILLAAYTLVTIWVGLAFGWVWAILAVLLIPVSLFATLFVLEKQAQLLVSIRSVFRLAWLRSDIEALADERKALVSAVRTAVDRYADPRIRRIFDASDFGSL